MNLTEVKLTSFPSLKQFDLLFVEIVLTYFEIVLTAALKSALSIRRINEEKAY